MRGIWRHAALLNDESTVTAAIAAGWTLGEGETPLVAWPDEARTLDLASLSLKREDANPGRSHKDRGLLYQVAAHRVATGARSVVVVSSSGNAAISGAAACRATGDLLLAFVSPETSPAKQARLAASGAEVFVSDKPINYARYAARVFGLSDLRGSVDPLAPVGYRTLAAEILEQGPETTDVLTFSSSGASARGLVQGFERLGRAVAVWAVQAGSCLGLARVSDPELAEEPDNPAGRLGVRAPADAVSIVAELTASGGGVIVVRRPELEAAAGRMLHAGLRSSAEGAAVVAAAGQLPAPGSNRQVVAIITGDAAQWERPDDAPQEASVPNNSRRVDGYLALRELLIELGLEPL